MIMQRLRNVTKYFMWVVAVAFILFIFFGFGSNVMSGRSEKEKNIIAEVNGRGIGYREFGISLNEQLRLLSGAIGIDPIKERKITDKIVNELIMDEIITEQLNERDITISDEQVIQMVKNSPPREIYSDSSFWIGNQFDYERYHELLRNPRASEFVRNYAMQIKEDLPRRIIEGEILSLVRLTNNEIYENLMDDSVEVKIEYIKLPLEEWITGEVSESPEIFYMENKEKFRRDGRVYLGYISLPIEVDNQMIESTRELALTILERAKNVAFDTLTKIYSYIPEGRNLYNDWIPVNELPTVFKNYLVGMRTGEITEPILTEDGFHIIQLIERERSSVFVKEIFLPVFPSHEEYMNSLTEAWNIVDRLKNNELVEESENVKYINYEKGYIPDIDVDFGTFLDEPKEEGISYPLIGNDSLYVFWIERVDSGIPGFDVIKDEVVDSLKIYEASFRAEDYIKENFGIEKLPRYPSKGAGDVTPYFTIKNHLEKGVYLPEKILNLAFTMKEGMVTPPIRAGNSIYIMKILDRKMLSNEKISDYITEYVQSIQFRKRIIYYHGWLFELRRNAAIKDMRGRLYQI